MTGYYTAVIFITVFSMLAMVIAAYSNSFLERERKRGFIAVFCCIALVAGAEWLGIRLDGAAAGLRGVHIAAKCVEFSLSPAIPVICAGAVRSCRSTRWMAIPLGVHAALELLSARFGFIFFVDAGNVYHRRGEYWIYIAAVLLGIVFLFYRSYQLSNQYQNRKGSVLALILIFLVSSTGIQIIDRTIRISWISAAMAAMLFYIYFSELIQQMDATTTLLNRRSYDRSIESLARPAMVLFFDVDNFKEVNDRYGHQFGDVCLLRVGQQIRAAYGKYGLCYRFGGDEFCVILQRQLGFVEKLNASFLRRMEHQRETEPRLPWVSMGYSRFDPAQEKVETAMRRADAMMYRYKQRKKEIPPADR